MKVAKAKKKEVKIDMIEDDKVEQKVNNKRGSVISTFSKEARRNMMYTIARVRRDCLPCFVTLTYPAKYNSDPKSWKRDLHIFAQRLGRRFEDVAGIWKLEPQRRGAPHYHLLLWNVLLEDLRGFVPREWNSVVALGDSEHLRWHLGELNNGNVHCVQEVKTQKAMYQYVTKYISKVAIEDWKNVGKWWGMLRKSRIPFGEEVVFEITDSNVLGVTQLEKGCRKDF